MNIDHGRSFDFGKTSSDYAKYRDIYPQKLYGRLLALGIGARGQNILDLGTGTGVLPRNLAPYGAHFTGTDLSPEQIEQARLLSQQAGLDIQYQACAAEEISYPPKTFDAVTACQCFFYFNHQELAPKLYGVLKPAGKLAVIYMAWLPYEDSVAQASEKLVLKYNPSWSGKEEVRRPIVIDPAYDSLFTRKKELVFDVLIPFTRESWAGRLRACRGVGASLSADQVRKFDQEHNRLLCEIAPEQFSILHYCAITVLEKRPALPE